MNALTKNLQKILILFFVSASVVIITVGTIRAKKNGQLATGSPQNPTQTGKQNGAVLPSSDTGTTETFSGAPYQTPWGNASAEIKVKNGKVVAVSMPQIPNSPPSQYAEQYLVQQALETGSANIQGVSGATYTSIAFKSSLESALAKAEAQGTTITGGTVAPAGSITTTTSKPKVPRKYREDDDENEWWDH